MSALLDLADRVEGLEGPDRDIDREIMALLRLPPDYAADWGPQDNCRPAPFAYTASIDAAIALLDQYGVLLHLSDIGADGLPLARVGRPDLDQVPIFTGISSQIALKATPASGLAIALCAAALRARAAQVPE
ncbi:hypothetical protein ABC347_07930 [Sphingomonas sp. 1P06PA]|uniref:hypothetical protein n=1 Tax=Sphingomonas sp. 1P06PA TaxID=554121 RepID=UPI0039A486EF